MRRRSVDRSGAKPKSDTRTPAEMVVTSETLGPPVEERLFDDVEGPKGLDGPRSGEGMSLESWLDSDEERPKPGPLPETTPQPAIERALADDEQEQADRKQRDEERRQKASSVTAESLEMGGGFGRVITHMFGVTDPFEEYAYLRGKLRSTKAGSALTQGELLDALDEAEENAFRAAELLAQAKLMEDDFGFDATLIESSMRLPAIAKLEEKKADLKASTKTSGKAITDSDVDAVMAEDHPDEWHVLRRKRARVERGVKLFSELHERLVQRAGHLRTMVQRSRTSDSLG